MSTSHVPIYYDNHLVGSITLAEFMDQPRYNGMSVKDLMSLNKPELARAYLLLTNTDLDFHAYAMRDLAMNQMLWYILVHFCGEIQWEKDAIWEIRQTYLTPRKK